MNENKFVLNVNVHVDELYNGNNSNFNRNLNDFWCGNETKILWSSQKNLKIIWNLTPFHSCSHYRSDIVFKIVKPEKQFWQLKTGLIP